MSAATINLTRKLAAMKSDLELAEKILVAGGFRDADGDWHTAGDHTRNEAKRLREAVAETERKISELN